MQTHKGLSWGLDYNREDMLVYSALVGAKGGDPHLSVTLPYYRSYVGWISNIALPHFSHLQESTDNQYGSDLESLKY